MPIEKRDLCAFKPNLSFRKSPFQRHRTPNIKKARSKGRKRIRVLCLMLIKKEQIFRHFHMPNRLKILHKSAKKRKQPSSPLLSAEFRFSHAPLRLNPFFSFLLDKRLKNYRIFQFTNTFKAHREASFSIPTTLRHQALALNLSRDFQCRRQCRTRHITIHLRCVRMQNAIDKGF